MNTSLPGMKAGQAERVTRYNPKYQYVVDGVGYIKLTEGVMDITAFVLLAIILWAKSHD